MQEIINPTTSIPMPKVMCQVRSLYLLDVMPTTIPARPDRMYGGQVRIDEIDRLNLRLPITAGKKLLKEQELRCMFWMKAIRKRRGSEKASFKPAMRPLD